MTVGNHRSSPHDEEIGVPQGSVIVVTIFLVAMSGVLQSIPRGVFLKVYADDITIIVVGVHPKAKRRKAQAATTNVGIWAAKAGFDTFASKSAKLHICAKNHQAPRKPIVLNQEVIPTKEDPENPRLHPGPALHPSGPLESLPTLQPGNLRNRADLPSPRPPNLNPSAHLQPGHQDHLRPAPLNSRRRSMCRSQRSASSAQNLA